MNLLKSRPAAALRRKLEFVQNDVSVFFCNWVELNECFGTIFSRRDQLEDSTSVQTYFQNTDCQKQSKLQLERLRKQIQSCVNTNERPEKFEILIESRLRVRDQTLADSKGKLALLKALSVAQKRKDTEEFSQKANAIIQLWYAYLDGAEGNQKASDSQYIFDSFQHVVSGSLITQSNSGAETTLMTTEGEPSAPPESNLNAIID